MRQRWGASQRPWTSCAATPDRVLGRQRLGSLYTVLFLGSLFISTLVTPCTAKQNRLSISAGVHHLPFSGSVITNKTKVVFTLHVYLKCQINATSPTTGDMSMQGFAFPVSEHEPIFTDWELGRGALQYAQGLADWLPNITISIAKNATVDGYAPKDERFRMRVLAQDRSIKHWWAKKGHPWIPMVLMAERQGVSLVEPLDMRIMVNDWPGYHFWSTGLCKLHVPSKPVPQPIVVVSTKPAYGTSHAELAQLMVDRVAYLKCLGVNHVIQYVYVHQLAHLRKHPTLQAYIESGIMVLVNWPLAMYTGRVPTPAVDAVGINGITWDNLFYTHALLRVWDFSQPAYIIGQDFDELLSSSIVGPINWPAFFAKYPTATTLQLRYTTCAAAKSIDEMAAKCPQVFRPTVLIEGKCKTMLDAWNIQQTGQSHVGSGTHRVNVTVSHDDLFFIHLHHRFEWLENNKARPTFPSAHTWVLNSSCFQDLRKLGKNESL